MNVTPTHGREQAHRATAAERSNTRHHTAHAFSPTPALPVEFEILAIAIAEPNVRIRMGRIMLKAAVPEIHVSHSLAAKDFYSTKLGFKCLHFWRPDETKDDPAT